MTIRTRAIWLLLAATLLISAAAPAAKDSTSGEVDVSVNMKFAGEEQDAGMPSSFSGHLWFSGNKARSEVVIPLPAGAGGEPEGAAPASRKTISIIDGDARVAYMLMPEMKMAMKLSLDDPQMRSPDKPSNPRDVLDVENYPEGAKLTKVGTKTYGGTKVTVYRVTWTMEKASVETLVYVDAHELPLYSKTTTKEVTIETKYSSYKFHKIDPAMFKVPEGYQITDMAEMMKGMPAPPG